MKKVILAAALMSAFTAHATVFGNTTHNNQTYNQPQSHATANGGTGVGVGVGVGVGFATGGNATGGSASVGDIRNTNTAAGGSVIGSGNSSNDIRNAVNNSNTNLNNNANSNTNANVQGQSQSTNNSNNASQSVTVEGDAYAAQARNPVSTAYAPNIMPTANCLGSFSGGAQGVGFGFSIGSSKVDENCQNMEQIRMTTQILGQPEVARVMMKQASSLYAEALKEIANANAPSASASFVNEEVKPASFKVYTGNDEVVRARLGLPPISK